VATEGSREGEAVAEQSMGEGERGRKFDGQIMSTASVLVEGTSGGLGPGIAMDDMDVESKPGLVGQATSRPSVNSNKSSNGACSIYSIRKATAADVPCLAAVERSAGEVFRTVGLDALADDEPMPAEVLRKYADAGHVWVAVAVVAADNEGKGKLKQEVEAHRSMDGLQSPLSDGQSLGKEVVVGFLACFPIVHDQKRQKCDESADAQFKEGLDGQSTAYLHIAELSVHASHQKRGLGRRMLAAMFEGFASSPRVDRSSFKGGNEQHKMATVAVKGYSLTTYRHLSFNKRFYESVGFKELDVARIGEVVGTWGLELWEQEQAGILRKEMRCWMIRDL
jgi:GNAT superfamily N-acetyltransferase